MREALVPGMQIAVIERGQVTTRAFGTTDVRTGSAVTKDTVFEAASIGKVVFSYGVLKLASAGRIDLDAPIGRRLEGLDASVAALTPRQLLSHTGGLPNQPPAGRLTAVAFSPPRFSYSGEGIRLLQRMVETVTGQDFQTYMQEAVFTPLGMTSSSFVWRDDYVTRKAFGHGVTGNWAGRTRMAQAQAPSSLETTADDYARFLIAVIGGKGLSADLARQMLQPQIALENGCVTCLDRPRTPPSRTEAWGLGIGLSKTGGRTFAWHVGDNQTMQSYAAIGTDGTRGVVILSDSANAHSIIREIATTILGVDAPGYTWLNTYSDRSEPVRRLTAAIVRHGMSGLSREDRALAIAKRQEVARRLIDGDRASDAVAVLQTGTGPDDTAAELASLADAMRRSGDLDGASESARRALAQDPGNTQARAVLDRVSQERRQVPSDDMAQFAGRYSSPFGPLTVARSGRGLTATLLDQPPSALVPIGDNSFLMDAMGVPIEFVRDARGKVTHAIVRAGGEIKLPRSD